MLSPPSYFAEILAESSELWQTLENNAILAAPWYQLFRQVQSPRHVISELLQNADDAGATEAKVELADTGLVFVHNGEDFKAEHLASLCRFGYSNKRALHTIGFRGVGFKSTFSLGNPVEIITPTLSIAFDEKRFTEPIWNGTSEFTDEWTRVRVPVRDEHCRRELEKNLDEWRSSPVSLLFFRNIRALTLGAERLRWVSSGAGPVNDAEWMALESEPDSKYLVVRSSPSLSQQMLFRRSGKNGFCSMNNKLSCRRVASKLFLALLVDYLWVLPTGVLTKLPFACNAPFVQDPARLKIKDPETSPTNRWLLDRTGTLGAKVMRLWLERRDLEIKDRAQAYGLLPNVDRGR